MSTSTWVVLPIVVTALGAIAGLLLRRTPSHARFAALVCALANAAVAAVLIVRAAAGDVPEVRVGGWGAPIGIRLVADRLAAAMVGVTALVYLASVLSLRRADDSRAERGGIHGALAALILGVNGAFLTGDLFNLYVWFEVLLVASFTLFAVAGGRTSLRAGVPYLLASLVSSSLLLIGVGLAYGITGTLDMSAIGARLAAADPGVVGALGGLLAVAFALKAAVFPLFAWLPSSYPTLPPVVSGVFAGLLTKVGVYALLRTFTQIVPLESGWIRPALLAAAGLTMLAGVLGAASRMHTREVLSFHVVSQIGYMVLGVAIGTPLAIAATVIYLVHHVVTKTALFLAAGLIADVGGSEDLRRVGGLARKAPWLAPLLLIPAASLAGIPPFSGFWAKLAVMRATLDAEAWLSLTAALVAGLLTLYSMIKIWSEAFWKEAPSPDGAVRGAHPSAIAGAVLLVGFVVLIGFAADPVWSFAQAAAADLLAPQGQVAFLGGGGG